jgi:hypothetical protein
LQVSFWACWSFEVVGVKMAQALKWQDVDSSNVSRIAYDAESQTLGMNFLNGTFYSYDGVGPHTFDELQSAPSIGGYFNTAIKKSYPYMKHDSAASVADYVASRREKS